MLLFHRRLNSTSMRWNLKQSCACKTYYYDSTWPTPLFFLFDYLQLDPFKEHISQFYSLLLQKYFFSYVKNRKSFLMYSWSFPEVKPKFTWIDWRQYPFHYGKQSNMIIQNLINNNGRNKSQKNMYGTESFESPLFYETETVL